MPPIDPTVGYTPWWVNEMARVATFMSNGRYSSLSEKDKKIFREAIRTISEKIEENEDA